MNQPVPQHCPSPRELDDLELLLNGALAPRTTYDDQVRLDLPAALREHLDAGGALELVDPEGLPLALLGPEGLTPRATPAYGPFRRLHRSPAQVREDRPGALVVPIEAPLTEDDVAALREEDGPVVLLALCGAGRPRGVTPVGLVRATLAAAALLPDAEVVACPLADHDDPALDRELATAVAQRYGDDVREPRGDGTVPDAVAAVVAQDRPDPRGLVVFFTGLSGSGKSTLARALHDLVLEDGRRTVTSLDGDVVRRHLSAGLGFSRADRETNIARIGWVAAEIARHGGVAICSPIAPFDATRRDVRAMVEDAGGRFVLVHVATPLEECERRDRKGLYAKARAGQIPDFTGISSPYDVPADAAVTVDTTGLSVAAALAPVLAELSRAGLALPPPPEGRS